MRGPSVRSAPCVLRAPDEDWRAEIVTRSSVMEEKLAQAHMVALELDEAELLITRALELAGESGSVRARMWATLSYGWFLRLKGELDAAETVLEEVRATAEELGLEHTSYANPIGLDEPGNYSSAHDLARTLRTDRWWLPPLLTFAGLTAWVAYATVRAFMRRGRETAAFAGEPHEH